MILGKGVADALGVKQGAYVTVMIPNSDPEMKLLQPKRIRLHVTGILQLSGQLDHSRRWCRWPMRSSISTWVTASRVSPSR